jgi:hypothetical protein
MPPGSDTALKPGDDSPAVLVRVPLTSTTLADLFTLRARADLFSAVWASLRWRSGDERHDGVTDGRQQQGGRPLLHAPNGATGAAFGIILERAQSISLRRCIVRGGGLAATSHGAGRTGEARPGHRAV